MQEHEATKRAEMQRLHELGYRLVYGREPLDKRPEDPTAFPCGVRAGFGVWLYTSEGRVYECFDPARRLHYALNVVEGKPFTITYHNGTMAACLIWGDKPYHGDATIGEIIEDGEGDEWGEGISLAAMALALMRAVEKAVSNDV